MHQLLTILGFVVSFCCMTNSHAAVIVVENTLDSGTGSLRDAVGLATDGDTILVNIKGTITLDSQIDIIGFSNLTILGPYPKHNTITANTGWAGSLFYINNSEEVLISGLGFSGGNGNTRHVTIENCPIGIIKLQRCLFQNDTLSTLGGSGAVSQVINSRVKFMQCSFINNEAEIGGALNFNAISKATIQNCTFSGNNATGYAGAIFVDGTTEISLEYNTFIHNTSSGAPEAVKTTGGTRIYIENNAIGDNGTGQQLQLLGIVVSNGGNRIKLN
mgnify:CR=1 FL=1